MKHQNASVQPKVYYGLHFAVGVAEYREPGVEPYRIMINEQAAKQMDTTFVGCPVFVGHVEEVDLKKINEADGYVVESFFNKADGKHWCKFIVISDRGHQAIRNGWKLSNAYVVETTAPGGQWHGVDYVKEVMSGKYEHLAIVDNPRYAESIILTPEQFKAYNEKKNSDLERLKNQKESKKEKKVGLLNFFKKEKYENSADLESMSVLLPKSKKEVTVVEAIEIADRFENMHGYANGDHMVKVGEEEMSVNELCEKYGAMKNAEAELLKKNADDEEKKKKENESAEKEEPEMKNGDAEKEEPEMKNEEDEEEKDKKENSSDDKKKEIFNSIKNAHNKGFKAPEEVVLNQVERGKQLYGSDSNKK